jgi:hypothetical protein
MVKETHTEEVAPDTHMGSLPPASQPAATHYSTFRQHPIRWMLAAIALFLLLLGILALSALAHLLRRAETGSLLNGSYGMHAWQMQDGERQTMRQRQSSTDNNFVTGVVTAVNSDGFTVAGNGTTKTVKTNGSTIYNTAGNTVAVNDTVSVTGVTSGDTFTATRVMVQNH